MGILSRSQATPQVYSARFPASGDTPAVRPLLNQACRATCSIGYGTMAAPQTQQESPPHDHVPKQRLTIQTSRLSKVYPGGTRSADPPDLESGEGQFFGLLGPNGPGKTTTIGMLTTRVVPTSGEMWIAGINVRARQQEVKRIIGVVTQFNTLDRRLTAWENLYHHGRYFGLSRSDSRREATRVLELVRLEERGNSLVDALSGGMQQRLLIGRALVHRPEVLFLDEPTTGIDPQGRLALWDMLLQLHRVGQTILLTTHYMEEAERLCQRVAIIDHGKV